MRPATKIESIKPFLDLVDLVLIMTVEPGFGGQSFMQDQIEKIKYVKANSKKDMLIEVDGGINNETSKLCQEAGANVMVAGNYIFGDKISQADCKTAIASLR